MSTLSATRLALAVGTPVQARAPGDVIPFARLAQRTRARRMWFGHSGLLDSQLLIAYFVGRGIDVSYGSSVALIPLQHPYDAALTARSIAVLSGQRYTAGFGPATPALVNAVRGAPYASPRTASVEYASILRELLDGDHVVDVEGEYFVQCGLRRFEPSPPVEVGLGVLRPAMARAAGGAADVAISWLTPPEYLRTVLVPALAEGAAGRPSPPRLVTLVQVAVRRPGRDPAVLADFAAGLHLQATHYRRMLELARIPLHADPLTSARALVEHGVFLYGSPDEIVSGLHTYREAGAGEIVVKTTGVHMAEGLRAAVDDMVAVFEAAGELTQEAAPALVGGR
ncbi:MAG: LLM class flavin-dependent oxidoreductase [Pseudonocardia sp.]|nr:LLM class flavin-dependent oxidoreductase [Pseudonocardia sp.]